MTPSQRQNPMSCNGMVTSPHYLASQAGLDILRRGGTAIDAAVATAATLAVVYPQMCTLGGDNFWLIYDARTGKMKGLNASGRAVSSREAKESCEPRADRLYFQASSQPETTPGTVLAAR